MLLQTKLVVKHRHHISNLAKLKQNPHLMHTYNILPCINSHFGKYQTSQFILSEAYFHAVYTNDITNCEDKFSVITEIVSHRLCYNV